MTQAPDREPRPLDRLCALYGVAVGYRDPAGDEHPVPDSTRRALLGALGVAVGDEERERASLESALEAEWTRVLPPVLVVRQGVEALELELSLPSDVAEGSLHWSLLEETGRRVEGILDLETQGTARQRWIEGRAWERRHLSLEPPSEPGYHRLELRSQQDRLLLAATQVILAPARCYLPDGVSGEHCVWGLETQLYGVRSARNWGIGDFSDLSRLVEQGARAGAGVLAVSPLHALFPLRPEHCDPYRPSSRTLLNCLYIDVEAIPELAECEQAQAELARDDFKAALRALRSALLVSYSEVARLKLGVLERLYRHFREHHLETGSPRALAFRAYREEQGEALERFALFQALTEVLSEDESNGSFRDWPEPYREPGSPAFTAFAREHADRVDFYAWIQWQAHQQLRAVGRRCLELRLSLGLCPELAIGAAPEGAEAWGEPRLFLAGVHAGAPPDPLFPEGCNRGSLAWNPIALRQAAYAPFADLLRANMSDAGALRIDHIAGLMRQFLIPEGADPVAGTYLSYPAEDLLGVLALESLRNRCLIIGGHPGEIPETLTHSLESLDILPFQTLGYAGVGDRGFLSPAELEPQTAVSASSHELPPLAGFWKGSDLEQRRRLKLFADEHHYEELLVRRSNDRARLLLALDHEGLLPEGERTDPVAVPELTPAHLRAVYAYLARSPAKLLLIQISDLLGQVEPIALPGSGDAYPNWRHRQPLEIEHWGDEAHIQRLFSAVRDERGVNIAPPEVVEQGRGVSGALIPRATYRLQLHAGFGFAAAADLIPYLDQLGISHCYFSPYLKARPGSTHGYDVIAHDQLNPELGTREDFERLCASLQAHGMGQILDMVPNHVGIMGWENRRWMDVLENGPASASADFFDIDWEPLRRELQGKVLVPVLGDHYGNVLDRGELRLVFDDGAFRIEYYDHHFPIDPREYPRILSPGLARLRERLGEDDRYLPAFESLVTAFANLPGRLSFDEETRTERHRDKELHKQRLAELARNADINWYLKECLRDFNGSEGYPPDTVRLHDLLEAQAYRLANWRVAADEINYRRFFDINDLAALRMENPETFDATHELVLGLVAEGKLAGLRIDHPDGLYDPAEYFRWVQESVTALPRTEINADGDESRPLYLVVEKILEGDERLPADWPVHGTTGYDYAALVDALLVDPTGEGPLNDAYEAFAGPVRPLADEVYLAKKLVMRNLLSSELHVLASEFARIAELDPHTRDFTLDALRNALMELVACFPVYRTYISTRGVSSSDRNQVLKAVSQAKRRSQAADLSVFDFVQDVILTSICEGKPEAYRARVLRLAMKLQQYTGPVTAKGVEDTAFYRYHRLVSLNEVGGDPERFGLGIEAFHRANLRRLEDWPHALLAGSTHDSKRSEDLRARLHVLSELPGEWRLHVERWRRLNRRFRRETGGMTLPNPNTEYLFYQTLLGVWPLEPVEGEALDGLRERIGAYMQKAVKEAKVYTAWTNPNSEYEEALGAFTESVLDPERNGAFFDDFLPFQRRIARLGLYNGLSQTLLRLTVPGVPDIYQGCELWSFALVDPDNRRAVDFDLRRRLLESLGAAAAPGADPAGLDADPAGPLRPLVEHLDDGRAKLHLIRQALGLRRADPDLFEHGDYRPLRVEGPHADRLCAFARGQGGRSVVVLAPRLLAALVPAESQAADAPVSALDPFADPGWETTLVEVPVRALRDALSGATLSASLSVDGLFLSASEVLRGFPVGLLTSGSRHGRA